jgi:hypothetical protein
MATTIKGTVTASVDLGGAAYASPLTVSLDGVIAPSKASAAGVVAVVADADLTNHGKISGGAGLAAGGGIGVDLLSGGDTLSNLGTISGGAGRDVGRSGTGFNGGIGITIESGAITNAGTIAGGGGGGETSARYGYVVGNGATGVILSGSSLVNNGLVIGGGAGSAGYFQGNGQTNVITGHGGTGLILENSTSSVVNRGTITGGYGGAVGIEMLAGGSLLNRGTITGTDSYFGEGAVGVLATNGLLANAGLIKGGSGAEGIVLDGGKLVNAGTIEGGEGASEYYGGSTGGRGVIVKGGAVLFNSGTISGGDGGFVDSEQFGFAGGAGVTLDGGTIVDSGEIDGGIGSGGEFHDQRVVSPAIHFGDEASTLIIEPTASFFGGVIANGAADDRLVLAGDGGTLDGLGRAYVDFTTIAEEATANWVLAGTNSIASPTSLLVGGVLAVSGKLIDDGSIVVSNKTGTLTLGGTISGTGTIEIDAGRSLSVETSFDGPTILFDAGRHGTLSLGAGVAVGSTVSGFSIGDTIQLALHATSLTYAGGTLTLDSGHKVIEKLYLDGSYAADDFHLGHGGTSADPITDITIRDTTAAAPPVLPDFASAIPQTAANQAADATGSSSALLSSIGRLEWDLLSPLHAIAR